MCDETIFRLTGNEKVEKMGFVNWVL